MRTFTTISIAAFVLLLARPVSADEVPLGTWTGFGIRLTGNNSNRQPASLVVKKVPDPHIVWRGGPGELLSAVFQVQNQNNQREVGSIALSEGRLTFSFADPDQGDNQTCVLILQPKEGTYVGDCMLRRLTLTPPAPPAAKPADAAK